VADQARLARAHQIVTVQNTDERQDYFLKDRYLQHILIRPGAKVEIDMVVDEIANLHDLSRTDRGFYAFGPKRGQPFPPHPVRIIGIPVVQARPITDREAELAQREASLSAREAAVTEQEVRLNAALK
jgi:hypothetical protein